MKHKTPKDSEQKETQQSKLTTPGFSLLVYSVRHACVAFPKRKEETKKETGKKKKKKKKK